MQSNGTSPMEPKLTDEQARQQRAEDTFWQTLGTLWNWRRFIVGVTGAVAIAAVVISLLLPNWYKAETRLLLPSSSGGSGMLGAVMQELPGVAQSLLGGSSGSYLRPLAILSSRNVNESVVDTFNLIEVYETSDSDAPVQDAIDQLKGNVEFVIDEEYDFLSVEVLDRDPQRAADIANYFVRSLEHVNNKLATENATNYRRFVEQRYNDTEARLDSVMDATKAFQEQYGVIDLQKQVPAFFESIAEYRLNAVQAELGHARLRAEYGSDNAATRAARQVVDAANQQYQAAIAGEEELLPIPKSEMPTAARQYFDLEKERLILTRILEFMRPLYEQARMDEQRQVQAVQVLDPAVPPVEKAKPRRSIICILATLSAFLMAVTFVLLYSWWQRNSRQVAERLEQSATEMKLPRSKAPIS